MSLQKSWKCSFCIPSILYSPWILIFTRNGVTKFSDQHNTLIKERTCAHNVRGRVLVCINGMFPIINIDRGSLVTAGAREKRTQLRYDCMRPRAQWRDSPLDFEDINIDHIVRARPCCASCAATWTAGSHTTMDSVNDVPWEAKTVVCLPSMIAVNYNTTRLFVCQPHIHTR